MATVYSFWGVSVVPDLDFVGKCCKESIPLNWYPEGKDNVEDLHVEFKKYIAELPYSGMPKAIETLDVIKGNSDVSTNTFDFSANSDATFTAFREYVNKMLRATDGGEQWEIYCYDVENIIKLLTIKSATRGIALPSVFWNKDFLSMSCFDLRAVFPVWHDESLDNTLDIQRLELSPILENNSDYESLGSDFRFHDDAKTDLSLTVDVVRFYGLIDVDSATLFENKVKKKNARNRKV